VPATNFTTRLLLRKPDPNPSTGDLINVVTDINDSMDKIDATIGTTVCTSGTRPTGTDRWDGRQIYETDTRRTYVWANALTAWLPMLVGRSTDGPYLLGQSTDTSGEGINSRGSVAGANMWRSRVTSDANPRFTVDADGAMNWGPGSAAVDTKLYRSAADTLKTDDSFVAVGSVTAANLVITTGATIAGSGVPLKISEQVLVGVTASITFSSIPSTFRSLMISTVCRSNNASTTTLNMRFNGDTGNNYGCQNLAAQQTTVLASESVGVSSIQMRDLAAAASTASYPSIYTIHIPWYASTTFMKLCSAENEWSSGTASGSVVSFTVKGRWSSTAAINSITLLPAAGSFIAGSNFALYGLP
jgi:hypothetical protein